MRWRLKWGGLLKKSMLKRAFLKTSLFLNTTWYKYLAFLFIYPEGHKDRLEELDSKFELAWGCPKGLWNLHSHRYSEAVWTRFCTTGSRCPRLTRWSSVVRSSLNHSVILYFQGKNWHPYLPTADLKAKGSQLPRPHFLTCFYYIHSVFPKTIILLPRREEISLH